MALIYTPLLKHVPYLNMYFETYDYLNINFGKNGPYLNTYFQTWSLSKRLFCNMFVIEAPISKNGAYPNTCFQTLPLSMHQF